MIITLLDIVGCTSGILGAILVGKINKMGYVSFMICNLAYGTLGVLQGYWGLVLVSIVMFVIDVYFFREWSKNENEIRQA